MRKSRNRFAPFALCLSAAIVAVPLLGAQVARAAAPDPAGTIYVADGAANAIDVFAPGASGNVAPERVISGSLTGLDGPTDVKVDSVGDVYASNFSASTITEYAPGASGNVAPINTIGGSNTGLDENDDMSFTPDGTLYVGNFLGADPVVVFAPGATGNATPIRTIAGTNTGLTLVDGVGVDAAGTLYADNTNGSSIEVFAPGANGNVAPEQTISGALTQLDGPNDVVVGFTGALYVTNGFGFGTGTQSVETFAPGASGNVAPSDVITGSNTGFVGTDDLAVDAAGTIYVTDSGAADVPIFAAGANGNVAPTSTIGGSLTTFQEPEGVAVAGPPAPASATVTTAVSAAAISQGDATHDTATFAGGTSPTGSLVFKLFGPGDSTCSGAPAYTSPIQTVSGDGPYTSPSFVPTVAGIYSWQALYSGDMNNTAITTTCGDPAETVTVTAPTTGAMTSLATSLSGGGSSGAQITVLTNTAVTDSAALTGSNAATATGTVTYNVYSDSGCTTLVNAGTPEPITTPGTLPPSSALSLPSTGTYYWQVTYSGDGNNAGSTSACGAETECVICPTTTSPTTTSTTSTTVAPTTTSTSTSTSTTTTTMPTRSSCKSGGYLHSLDGYHTNSPCEPRCSPNAGSAHPKGKNGSHSSCKHQRTTPTVPKCKPGYKVTRTKGRDVCTAIKPRSTVREIHDTLISATHTITTNGPFIFVVAFFFAAIGLVVTGRRQLGGRSNLS